MEASDSSPSLVDSAERRLTDLELFLDDARSGFPEKVLSPPSDGQPLTIERYLRMLDGGNG